MRKSVLACSVILLFAGLTCDARKKRHPQADPNICNEHVTKAIGQYLNNKSNKVSKEDSACLQDFIKQGGAKVVNRYEFESFFKVRHDISIVNIETKEVRKKK